MSKCVAIIFISLLFPTCAAHGATESHYACAATDSNVVLALDVTINDGGGEHVTRLSGSLTTKKRITSEKGSFTYPAIQFSLSDVRQLWDAESDFNILLFRSAPKAMYLTIRTSCNQKNCEGTYTLSVEGVSLTALVACKLD